MFIIHLYLLAVFHRFKAAAAKNFFELSFEEQFPLPRSLQQSPQSNKHARDFEEFENEVGLYDGYILKEDHDEAKLAKKKVL